MRVTHCFCRFIYESFYKRKEISRELYEYCLREKVCDTCAQVVALCVTQVCLAVLDCGCGVNSKVEEARVRTGLRQKVMIIALLSAINFCAA